MWWILVAITSLVLFAVIFVIGYKSKHEREDDDGTQWGMPLTPANDAAGIKGEKEVNSSLRHLLNSDEYLLTNLLLPLKNGNKTEIDCVLITRKGIFCIETKRWLGHISGNDEDDDWLQEYDDPSMSDRKHNNPVKQNAWHCRVLKRKLNNRYAVNNIVIFDDLEDGVRINSKHTFTINEFKDHYRKLNNNEIPEIGLKPIYQQLVKYIASPKELAKHKKKVNKKTLMLRG